MGHTNTISVEQSSYLIHCLKQNSVFWTYFITNLYFQVFVHSPGDEYWMSAFVFPYPITILKLETSTKDLFKAANLEIIQVDTDKASKFSEPCDSDIRYHFPAYLVLTSIQLLRNFFSTNFAKVIFFFVLIRRLSNT